MRIHANPDPRHIGQYAASPVDSAVLVEPDKGLGDGPAHLGVHCEAGPVPVHAGAQGAQLRVDRLTVLLLPLPHLALQI
jgi:hypothetical protein